MPELPEVETVRRSLAPYLEGAAIKRVTLRRGDLRGPFPSGFAKALEGRVIDRVERRAKYLLFRLSDGRTWLSHLGMSGSFRFAGITLDKQARYFEPVNSEKHDHVLVDLVHPRHGPLTMIFADARRFGSMDLLGGDDEAAPQLAGLGPEPLGNRFNAAVLAAAFSGRKTSVKAALLDQRVVAGLGNIYVSEALHRSHIRPTTIAAKLVLKSGAPSKRLEDLAAAIPVVLIEAIESGGSTLRDFRSADGSEGGFQHRFAVYDREGAPCPTPGCTGTVRRIVQQGRSSFYCPVCQK